MASGKYDDEAARIREALEARAVFLLVVDGKRGSGVSHTAAVHTAWEYAEHLDQLAQALRVVADAMDRERLGITAGEN